LATEAFATDLDADLLTTEAFDALALACDFATDALATDAFDMLALACDFATDALATDAFATEGLLLITMGCVFITEAWRLGLDSRTGDAVFAGEDFLDS
jgi:hypothetical protein